MLRPGETWTLADGTKVEFLGTRQWVTVSVRHDPGEPIVLGGAVAAAGRADAVAGRRRRRVWFRIVPRPTPTAVA